MKRTDPQIAQLLGRTKAVLREIRGIGMSPGLISVPNQGYSDTPHRHTPFPDPLGVRVARPGR